MDTPTPNFSPSKNLVTQMLKEDALEAFGHDRLEILLPGPDITVDAVVESVCEIITESIIGLFHTTARSLSRQPLPASYTLGTDGVFETKTENALLYRLNRTKPFSPECMQLFYSEVRAAAATGALTGQRWRVEARSDNTLVLVVTEPWTVKPPAPPRERAQVVHLPMQDGDI